MPSSTTPLPRDVSAWLLLALIAAIGLLFVQVIRPFVVAIFVSIVLAVLFTPLHQWLAVRIGGRPRIAAAVITILVLLLVLLPIGATLVMAGTQVLESGRELAEWFDQRSETETEDTPAATDQTGVARKAHDLYLSLPINQREQLQDVASQFVGGATSAFYKRTRGFLADAFSSLVKFTIITLALYYFLADRELFVGELHRLVPFSEGEEERITDQFQRVCRGVVLGTLVAGVVQATLAGIAYAVIGVPQLWILIVLTLFFSFIPFLGSALVWGAVAIGLLIEGRYPAAIGLAIFGAAIVSTSDNLVRAYVIGNQARLHPLIALITAIGAIEFIGLWGIFVGPMIAALLYPLIYIARQRLLERSSNGE